jgi:prepilin-type N-terminal cleavage/methylation domain-containing protein
MARPNRRVGFTLIELLIVVVIIGILASIAIPKYARTKEKAYVASMKSDLRNLAAAEENYAMGNNGAYFPATTVTNAAADSTNAPGYAPTTGVTVSILAPVTGGWSATATHVATNRSCGIFMGSAAPPNAAVVSASEVGCW